MLCHCLGWNICPGAVKNSYGKVWWSDCKQRPDLSPEPEGAEVLELTGTYLPPRPWTQGDYTSFIMKYVTPIIKRLVPFHCRCIVLFVTRYRHPVGISGTAGRHQQPAHHFTSASSTGVNLSWRWSYKCFIKRFSGVVTVYHYLVSCIWILFDLRQRMSV